MLTLTTHTIMARRELLKWECNGMYIQWLPLQNYNKSRIHSYRGAKDVEIQLDGSYIFKGEIARACGGTQGGTEAFGDVSS